MIVMPALVAGAYVFKALLKDAGGRDKAGHDDKNGSQV
jgi:hypothetical protein